MMCSSMRLFPTNSLRRRRRSSKSSTLLPPYPVAHGRPHRRLHSTLLARMENPIYAVIQFAHTAMRYEFGKITLHKTSQTTIYFSQKFCTSEPVEFESRDVAHF
ncbi:hypothetical protein VPH35_124602 [Triticum aestivum]